ncbi:hypothetical protein SAMN05443637_12189 [Pseudonocardia thermophila]|uniref:O-antigen ligase n=1 Tax=Pseudonocardia thermophila TaxID=1848 RepID=A0A1M6YUW6_PSETH|nr:hypothetical protein [Pseudonocardia thermophila]SHL22038.1 hypothetical protein SAMN05443637_12189 [Pseudonocardia thermophila]
MTTRDEPAARVREDTRVPPRVVGVAWGLLAVNTLGFTGVELIIPFPRVVGQLVTMGALMAAFAIALAANRPVRIRPSAYLVVLTLMVITSVVTSLRLESGMGSLFRCFRFTVFVLTLWLLARWWSGDLRFVGYHLRTYCIILLTVLAGLAISPGAATSGPGGRLVGALWPIPAPQVGMYCAVVTGLALLLALDRRLDRQSVLIVVVPAVGMLLLSHTRTALLGLVVGLVVAGSSLWTRSARARRFLAAGVAAGVAGAVVFGEVIATWLARGQDADELADLTGRAKVWRLIETQPRTGLQELMGVGLGDKSFAGLPIDSTWYSSFYEQGWIGVGLVVVVLLLLLALALLRPPSTERACALFLVVYSCIASFTEVGHSDASPYLLNLAVAASLLVHRPIAARRAQRESRA